MSEWFQKFGHHWRVLLSDHAYKVSFYVGMCMLIFAYLVNYLLSTYNDVRQYISVGDLILDRIPTYNVEFLFTWFMYFTLLMLFIYPIFFKPEVLPFAIKTFALLIFLRAGFIVLTNIGPPAGFFYGDGQVGGNYLADLMFRNDLFFSGHTAYPFMAFLIYRTTRLRWFFLISAIIEGITVLLMHVHYSIDVFAAFFITYGIYSFSEAVFRGLNERFRSKLEIYGWNAWKKLKNKS